MLLSVTDAARPREVPIAAGAPISTAIGNNPPGTIFRLAAGTWTNQTFTPKVGNEFWGDPAGGTILTGSNTTEAIFSQNPAAPPGVQFVKFHYITFQNYGISAPNKIGGVFVVFSDWTFRYCRFVNLGCSGVNATGSNNLFYRCYFDFLGHSAIVNGGYGSSTLQVIGCEISRCNQQGNDPSDAVCALGKFAGVDNVQCIGNYVHDNACTGIWYDIQADNALIDGNTVINCTHRAIHYEISTTAIIRNNVLNNNATTGQFGLFISTSADVDCYNNNMVVSASAGHAIVIQNDETFFGSGIMRTDAPPNAGTNLRVHNNTITFLGTSGIMGMRNYIAPSTAGTLMNNNTYRVTSTATSRFPWGTDNTTFTFAQLQGSPRLQEIGGTCTTGASLGVAGCTQTGCDNSGWFG